MFKGQEYQEESFSLDNLIHEDGMDKLSRNIGKKLKYAT